MTDISRWISDAATRAPAKTAVLFEGRELSYLELEQRIATLAGMLRRTGISVGDRVAYLGPNCPELLETLLACARLGAVFVPLNARMPAGELAVFTEQAGPAVLVAEEAFAHTACECAWRRQIPILAFSIGQRWDGPPVLRGAPVGASAPASSPSHRVPPELPRARS